MVAQTVIFGTKARFFCVLLIVMLCTFSLSFGDTLVRFDTILGSFDVQLSDTATPLTVQNFLNYVNDGDYVNSFFHRLVPGFILQGGGFTYDGGAFPDIPTDPPVLNEFSASNTYGTIAMAKLGPPPGELPTYETINSATNQFFFNLGDNSANLDGQNGGFTVFGEVIGDGMDVVNLLAAQATYDYSNIDSAFTDLPLIDYQDGQYLEMVNSITVVNTPEPATMGLLALGGLAMLRRKKRKTA